MATNKISEILNYFRGGFQRTNRFEVAITNNNITKNFWASSCQIPSQTVVFYPDNFSPSGPIINIPVKREYDERFLIDFIVEGDWTVRKYFEDWFNEMFTLLNTGFNTIKSNSVYPRSSSLGEISVKALDTNGNSKATFTLYEAYPKLLLPGQFTHDEPNKYLTLTVDFNYRYYKLT
jgi:hypothetical protein